MPDNPNWKTILDKLPESLHEIIKPALLEWDQGVTAKLQSVRDEFKDYEAYKDFIEQGIDPGYVMQSVQLADAIRQNPDEMVGRINTTYNLGYAKGGPANTPDPEEEFDDSEYDGVDITKHPQFQKVTQALEELQGKFTEDLTTRQQEEQATKFAKYIEELHEEHGEFDDIFVGAYLAQGYDPKEAVDIYRERIAGQLPDPTADNNNEGQGQGSNDATPPPVVLDGAGTGSGTEQPTVDFANMKKSDVMEFAEKFLQESANQ